MFKLITFPLKLIKWLVWRPIWHFVYFFLCRPILTTTLLIVGALYLSYAGFDILERWQSAIPPRPQGCAQAARR